MDTLQTGVYSYTPYIRVTTYVPSC